MTRNRTLRHYPITLDSRALSRDLLNWFATHQRDLPWRRSRDPYRIWVSEVMLQQTRVDTVIPYYERWFAQFPTLTDLASAPEERVLKAWEGLGYYSRARNLHQAAQEVVAHYGPEVPDDPEAVGGLKGVGSYTAGAILSIAFNRPVPAVDGNVMRVLSRLFCIDDDITQPATRKGMEELAQALIPMGQAAAFNQALMELGALICSPQRPKCLLCPVREHCQSFAQGEVEHLPVKARAKAPRAVPVVAAVIWHGDRVMIARRPPDGLLGGLWEFPGGEVPAELTGGSPGRIEGSAERSEGYEVRPEGSLERSRSSAERSGNVSTKVLGERAVHLLLRERFGLEVEVEAHLIQVRHVFSHLVWDLHAYTARLAADVTPAEGEGIRWVTLAQLASYPFPVAHQKVIQALPGKP